MSLATCGTVKVIRKQNGAKTGGRKNRYPLTTMTRMVTIPRKLNMDNFKFHLYRNQARKWKVMDFTHSFTLFSVYPYTGKVPRMWKLSK